MQSPRDYSTWSWGRPELTGCVICGKNDSPHRQRGICYRCSWRLKAQKERERALVDKDYCEKKKKQARDNATKRRLNPEVKEKEHYQCKKWYEKNKEYRADYYQKYYDLNWSYHRDRSVKRRLGLEPEEAEIVRRKNNYRCYICNEKKEKMDIHHLDGNGLNSKIKNNDINNLVYLCASCHSKETWRQRKNV